MLWLKELEQLFLSGEQDPFECSLWEYTFGQTPHAREGPAVVEHEDWRRRRVSCCRHGCSDDTSITHSLQPCLGSDFLVVT